MHISLVTPPAAEPLTLAEAKLHCRVDSSADDMTVSSLISAARRYCEAWTERTIPCQTWLLTLDRFPLYDGSGPRLGTSLGVGAWEYLEPRRIRLPRPPLITVNTVKYYDTTQTLQTLKIGTLAQLAADSTILAIWSNNREPGTIEPSYGQVWPVSRYEADSIQVNFTAGYPVTSVALAISSGAQTVTPGSMAGIVVGSNLTIDLGAAQEIITVTSVVSTTFTATFALAHAAGAKVCGVPDDLLSAMKLLVGHWYRNREAVDNPLMPVPLAVESLLSANRFGGYP